MAFPKGNKLGGRHKGSLNKETLVKEERRAMFDAKASENWEKVIAALIEKYPTYVADQFMEKAKERVEHEIKTDNPIIKKATEQLNELHRTGKLD